MTGVGPTDATIAFGTELSTRFQSMEHLTDFDTAGNEPARRARTAGAKVNVTARSVQVFRRVTG